MKIYNTLTKNKDEFKPQDDNRVKMYVCGPTVYDYAHIGNLRTYVATDLLRRWLKYNGFTVEEVMNVTDIEDKIIKKSKDEHVSYKDVTQKYEKAFINDLSKLNIELPEKMPHATDDEVIKQIVTIIKSLLEKGIAYKSDDGSVYFSVAKFKDYGKLSNIDLSGIKEGARVDLDEYEKEDAQDFALWKAKQDDEPSWPAPFGEGRPGWHIECSAMSTKYLGETIDLHAGGVDLVFPHHENEIAQSEAYTGKDFVKYWFHAEHLMVEGQKMSKSLNNIYTLEEMSKKYNVEPLAFRMLVLSSHYRERLNFTKESIEQAQNTLNNIRDFVLKNFETKGEHKLSGKETLEAFEEALNDDLNSPKAISVLFDYIKSVNIAQAHGKDVYDLLLKLDEFMGLGLENIKPVEIPENVAQLVKEREEARAKQDWLKSDQLRLKINSLGFEVEDTPEGSKVKQK
jgi:cysteinyl-tRNA synthetase